jgi:VWFA-related protein
VGLYSYPSGQQLPLTTDRAVLGIALGSLVGERHDFNGIFHLTPSEVVDITAQGPIGNPSSIAARARVATAPSTNDADPVRVVQARECPDDSECATRIVSEATAEALHLEAQVEASLGGLERLLQGLARFPGRKAVVLISAGVLVADRPGGRPDAGNLAAVLGRIAAQANTIVYTIHIDPAFTDAYRAGRRRAGGGERDRDRRMSGDWLEQFSASSGGARFHVPVGPGDFAFERVSRETSAYYLLGVEPQSADRDGQPRELKVRVDRRGVTVRSRQWVAMGR